MKPKSGLAILMATDKPKVSPSADSVPPEDQMDEQMPPTDDSEAPESVQSTDEGETCIPLPKGFKAPEDAKDGQSFQGIFRGYVKDGKLYFDSVNNIPLEGSAEEEASETPEVEKMEMDSEAPKPDAEDAAWAKKRKENEGFNKVFGKSN